ncbi:MAG: glycoside hydrolase family 5 protein, partial [Prevotella sp.]|nr:glycoside hydrolase family 5 protein [Prevotella sp.]
MKRLLLTMAIVFVAMAASANTPVKQWGQLQVKGAQLCDEQGQPVVLRGVSLGWHNLWPRFYNKKAVKWLKQDWHPTVVRAAIGASNVDDHYGENSQFALDCLFPVVDACISQGLYVIIDWHSHKLQQEAAVKFFGQMAKKYGNHPNVIYELYNEPVDDSWDALKQYAAAVITEIRKYDPDNIILMGCPHWDQDIHIVAESPLQGFSNVMYTVHFYAATHFQWLRDRMTSAVKKGIPVFVSECAGMEASGDGPLNEKEWQAWVDCMEANKVSYACWSVSDKNETCSMLLPRAKATGQWTDDLI